VAGQGGRHHDDGRGGHQDAVAAAISRRRRSRLTAARRRTSLSRPSRSLDPGVTSLGTDDSAVQPGQVVLEGLAIPAGVLLHRADLDPEHSGNLGFGKVGQIAKE
jgi:hypothetical protein